MLVWVLTAARGTFDLGSVNLGETSRTVRENRIIYTRTFPVTSSVLVSDLFKAVS